MSLDTAEKQKIIESHQVHSTDTGSVEIQVAMLTERIMVPMPEGMLRFRCSPDVSSQIGHSRRRRLP